MKVICGKCKARIKLNTEHVNTKVIKFKCPVCSTVNRLELKNNNESHSHLNNENTVINPENFDDIAGWLVVHDENTKQQTFPLKTGVNIVGRKSVSKPCDVMIETNDKYMSRNHFAVEISLGPKGFNYLVYDVTSTNGTFINADINNKLDQLDKVYLTDGDTIQAGRTKMVLRTKKVAGTTQNATNTVINTQPLKTIIA